MKLKVLALGAAVAGITCVTPCSAQLHIESASASQPQSRIAFQDTPGVDAIGQPQPSSGAAAGSQNIAPNGSGERIGQGLSDPKSIFPEQSSGSNSSVPGPAQASAGAIPNQPALGALANTPEVGLVPVCWPEGMRGCRTPNPIADYMMLNWCTDGLWDTYPAQRACQCAHIQHHTGGYNRYTGGCNTCASGCASCAHGFAGPSAMSNAPVAYGALSSNVSAPNTASLEGVPEVPAKATARFVISPVMSAPSHLPTAQIAPSLPATTAPAQAVPAQASPVQVPQAQVNPAPVEPVQAAPAEGVQPRVRLYPAIPSSPLPSTTESTANVASRPAGFFR